MRPTARVASLALAATLAIVACGSDDSGSADTEPTTPATAAETTVADTAPEETVPEDTTPEDTTPEDTTPEDTTPEEPAQDVEADTEAAEAALVTVADLPEGWTEATAGDAVAALDARLAECVAVDGDALSASDASAVAGPFADPAATTTLAQHVGVLATERDARSVVALTVEPSVLGCFEAAYTELGGAALAGRLTDGAQTAAPTVERLAVGSAGDATQAIRVVVPVTGDPVITAATVDTVVVRSGRSLSTLTFTSVVEPTAVETIDAITAVVADRLPA
jgi:hypothetical protein